MKKLLTTPALLALLLLLLGPASAAHADEPIEALRGSWRAESLAGTIPPPNVFMIITFLDTETVKMDIISPEGSEDNLIRYTATAEGAITFFPEPETNPAGDVYRWEVRDDGKLVMTGANNETLIFAPYVPAE